MFRLKIKYQKYEPGEFSESIPVNFSEAEAIFELHTTTQTYKNTYTILFPNITFLLERESEKCTIQHLHRDQFTIYYHNKDLSDVLESRCTTNQIMPKIKYLFENNQETFSNGMQPGTLGIKDFRNSFERSNFTYTYKKQHWNFISKYVLPSFIFIIMVGLTFVLLLHNIPKQNNTESPTFLLIITSIFSFLSLTFMALNYLINKNFKQNSQNNSIQISKGNESILIHYRGQDISIQKSDIIQLIFNYNPFDNYRETHFTTIVLSDLRKLHFPNQVIDYETLRYKFKKIEEKEKKTLFLFIPKDQPDRFNS